MIPPDETWDRYPNTMRVTHVAEVFSLQPDTVRKHIRAGDPMVPPPFLHRPYRWRKAEVKRHYERLTVRDLRMARAHLRHALRKVVG